MNRPPAPRPAPRALVLRALGAALAACALLLGPAAGIASAHGGPGAIEVLGATVTGSTVDVRVKVTFKGDGDPSGEATVTVAGSSGTNELTPVTLTAVDGQPGVYAGAVTLPVAGDWSLRFTSVEPPATATVPVTAAAPVTGAAPGGAAPVSAAGDAGSTTTTDPSQAGDAAGGQVISPAPSSDDSSDEGAPWMWIVGGLAAAAAVAVGVVFVARGRRTGIE